MALNSRWRSMILLCAALNHACTANEFRRLSFDEIAFYKPRSQVTDHNAIDLDQKVMEDYLNEGTDASFDIARNIYMYGGHSKSLARIKLDQPLKSVMKKGTEVIGEKQMGGDLKASALIDIKIGVQEFELRYATSEKQDTHVTCQVGALPDAKFDGCFPRAGNFTWTAVNLDTNQPENIIASYTYDPAIDNVNGRTLMSFSTNAEDRMYTCMACPYFDYKLFYLYYGEYDYAHQFIEAAFNGGKTQFLKGNADFGLYGFKGRAKAIEKATVALSTTMYVIREMEDGIDDCEKSCLACNDEPVHAWDEAVAFFTGSLEGFDGNGKGKLFRAWSEDLCTYFKTCGEDGDLTTGTSKSNHEILIEFFIGQNSIFLGFCNAAEKSKVKIVSWMKVVMVQGALLYAYKTHNEEYSEEVEAIGAVAMAAVVPYINACEPADADIIYGGLAVGSKRRGVGFKEIKEAFERNYDCPEMDILCSQVGGIFDSEKFEYMKDAEPCKDKPVVNIDTLKADTDTSSSASQTSCTLFLISTLLLSIFSVLR